MRRLRPEHPLHRALCALLCLVLVLTGGFGAAPVIASDAGCAPAQCCCGDGDDGGCAEVCLCEVPASPPAPVAPVVASPSLVELATPPAREPIALESHWPPAPRAWCVTVASHALPARALHVAHCVFLC